MNVKKMWKLVEWVDWVRDHPETTDLSFHRNDYGEIPLSCGRCKKKVQDIDTKLKKDRAFVRAIYCSLCGWESYRTLGKMRRGK